MRTQTEKRTLASGQIPLASATFEISIKYQGLPAQYVGKELGRSLAGFRRSRTVRFFRPRRGRLAAFLGGFVPLQLGLGVVIGIVTSPSPMPGPTSSSNGTPVATAMGRSRLIANAFANPLRLLDQIVEKVTDIARYAVDDGKDLLENVSNQVRGGYAKTVGEIPDVLGKLLRNSGMEDPLFPRLMTIVPTTSA